MGYLTKASGLTDFSKVVISVWFRIPVDSLAAARAQYDAANAVFPNTDLSLIGIIPILTFGPGAETYVNHNGVSGAVTSAGPISSCVIGVSCGDSGGSIGYGNVLYARMQYSTGAAAPVFPNNVYNDFFQVGAQLSPSNVWGSSIAGSAITVAADQWHHVLVSFDLSGGCSSTYSAPDLGIDSTCPFYWSFDDVNYSSKYLWPNTPVIVGDTDVPNGIFSDRCIQNSGSFSFAAGNIPTSGNAFGVPSDQTDHVYKIEMAELQVYTDVTLDTSNSTNRRAFVTSDGRPESMGAAALLLGKTPEVYLHGLSRWQSGTNSGTAGHLTPTGTINPFTPGPSLT